MGGLIPIALFNIAPQLMGLIGNISLGLSAFWLGNDHDHSATVGRDSPTRSWDIFPITREPAGVGDVPTFFVGGIAVAASFVAMWWVPRGDWVRAFFAIGLCLQLVPAGVHPGRHARLLYRHDDFRNSARRARNGDVRRLSRAHPPVQCQELSRQLVCHGNALAYHVWLGCDFFRGPGGDLADGMRYVSMVDCGGLIPMSYWWFIALREPGFAVAKEQRKSALLARHAQHREQSNVSSIWWRLFSRWRWALISFKSSTTTSRSFIFMAETRGAAGPLLGIAGTAWAVTGLVAVFPLNWLSRRLGKNKTLLIAILLMCCRAAFQNLLLQPGAALSGSHSHGAAIGRDVDVLHAWEHRWSATSAMKTNSRPARAPKAASILSTGGSSKWAARFASFVMGILLVFTGFDEKTKCRRSRRCGAVLQPSNREAEEWKANDRCRVPTASRLCISRSIAASRMHSKLGISSTDFKVPIRRQAYGTLNRRTDSHRPRIAFATGVRV